MIIGIDASRANRKNKTGTEWYSFYLIKELARLDRINHYRLYLDQAPQPELLAALKDAPNFSVKLLSWPLTSFWTLGRLSLEMLFHRPDILFVPAHGIPLIHPRQTVNTIHDVAFMDEAQVYRSEAPAAKTQKRRRFLKKLIRLATLGHYDGNSLDYLRWSTKFALKHAWRIITVSAATKDDILKNYPWAQASKIVVVHNGFPAELFNGERDPERIAAVAQRYNLTAPYYLYVGRLEKKKNTPALIEALSIVRSDYPEIKESLVLIGNASYGYDEVKYTIEELNPPAESANLCQAPNLCQYARNHHVTLDHGLQAQEHRPFPPEPLEKPDNPPSPDNQDRQHC
jgi:glycosyltransferase involved in cell wall biosynthesis